MSEIAAHESNDRKLKQILLAIAFAGLAFRLFLCSIDLNVIDRWFLPDDTYYILSIARSLARGCGPMADSIHLTNGFQPLIAFLLTPIFAFSQNPDLPLRVALVILAIADSCCIYLVGMLAGLWANNKAAILASSLWAVSPVAISNALNGMETQLSILMSLALVTSFVRLRKAVSVPSLIGCGVLSGLCLLSRVDTVFLVVALFALEFFASKTWKLWIAAVSALLVVAPWWIYSTLTFGSFIPESGNAVRHIVVTQHPSICFNGLAFALLSTLPTPFFDLLRQESIFNAEKSLHNQLRISQTGAEYLVLTLSIVAGLTLAFFIWSRPVKCAEAKTPITALKIHALIIGSFYAFYLPAIWFFRRYLEPLQLIWLLALVTTLAPLLEKNWQRHKVAVIAIMISLPCIGFVNSMKYINKTPEGSVRSGYDGATGYHDAAMQMLRQTPDGARLGALQSGALAYFADKKYSVINLDGVVNKDAIKALRNKEIIHYIKSSGIQYLADWPFNIIFLAGPEANASQTEKMVLKVVGEAAVQGRDKFILCKIKN
jgi:hypothetical protein